MHLDTTTYISSELQDKGKVLQILIGNILIWLLPFYHSQFSYRKIRMRVSEVGKKILKYNQKGLL